MLEASDLAGVDETLALRIIAHAISIAPGLDLIPSDSPLRPRAIAVLKGVAQEARQQGSRRIAGRRVGPASIDFRDIDSWFSADDRSALRAACQPLAGTSAPLGSFPKPGIIGRLWPEDRECI